MSRLLVEEVRQGAIRVDMGSATLRRVKLLGWKSSNNRSYAPEGVSAAMYEGRPIHLNHPARGAERSVQDRIGRVVNVTKTPHGVYGDIELLRSHPYTPSVLEMAERWPNLVGCSHVAKGETRRGVDGRDEVCRVTEVSAVDLVCEPASTSGLFSEQRGRRASGPPPLARAAAPASHDPLGRLDVLRESHRGYARRVRVDRVAERLSRVDRRLAKVFLETCEAGIMGTVGGEAQAGIHQELGPDEKRRAAIKAAVIKLLDDQSVTLDSLADRITAILNGDAEELTKATGAVEKAEEGRRREASGFIVADVVGGMAGYAGMLVNGGYPVTTGRRLSETRRGASKVPSGRAERAAWLNGRG